MHLSSGVPFHRHVLRQLPAMSLRRSDKNGRSRCWTPGAGLVQTCRRTFIPCSQARMFRNPRDRRSGEIGMWIWSPRLTRMRAPPACKARPGHRPEGTEVGSTDRSSYPRRCGPTGKDLGCHGPDIRGERSFTYILLM